MLSHPILRSLSSPELPPRNPSIDLRLASFPNVIPDKGAFGHGSGYGCGYSRRMELETYNKRNACPG